MVASYTYDPYGKLLTSSGTGAAANAFRYAGQYTDTTGLQYLRARYYDPVTAQFLTRDPIEPQTRSAYGYAGDTPVNATDPSGTCGVGSVSDALNSVNPFSRDSCARVAVDAVAGMSAEDWLHLGLGVEEIADGVIVGTTGAVAGAFCFVGVSAAPVIGQVAGYPACTVLVVGATGAAALSFASGYHQLTEIGNREDACE